MRKRPNAHAINLEGTPARHTPTLVWTITIALNKLLYLFLAIFY
jgi:hypothetical protein